MIIYKCPECGKSYEPHDEPYGETWVHVGDDECECGWCEKDGPMPVTEIREPVGECPF